MARTKETPRPLFAVKGEFMASLDAASQAAINLLNSVEMLIRYSPVAITDELRVIHQELKRHTDALRRTLMIGEENESEQ